MHTLKVQPGIQFDSTTITFDSTTLTLDSNDQGVFFPIFPYRFIIGSTVRGEFFDELRRTDKTLTLSVEPSSKNTFRIFIPFEDFIEKSTYRFELFSGATEVYRGKLFAVFGNTQNYSVYENETI